MAQWGDIVTWENSGLATASQSLLSERQKALDAALDTQRALNAIQSEGETVDAMKAQLRELIVELDARVNELSELMMATAAASDGVSNVEALVAKAQGLAAEGGFSIQADGSVSGFTVGISSTMRTWRRSITP
ncbi:hypothetical protein [Schaalia vaccimaxillae]|uniref:hypothetical protein n=1 Tax=Schaalia vaccimaxillae TaxID=183916 RepID=UPI00040BD2CC|nr:hypothetical protein [Schaalia vaccimaxillae]